MAVNFAAFSMVPAIVLTGCERKISSANIEIANRQLEAATKRISRSAQVKEGLSLKEVESILGQPARVETEKRPILVQKNLDVTRWYYEQDGKTIELLFVDGNLQGRIPQFGEAPVPAAAGSVETTAVRLSPDDTAR